MSYHLEIVAEEDAWFKENDFDKDESGICYLRTIGNINIVLDISGLGRVYAAKIYLDNKRIYDIARESAIGSIEGFMFDVMFTIDEIANNCNNVVTTFKSENWVKNNLK